MTATEMTATSKDEILALADELQRTADRAGKEWGYWLLVTKAVTALRRTSSHNSSSTIEGGEAVAWQKRPTFGDRRIWTDVSDLPEDHQFWREQEYEIRPLYATPQHPASSIEASGDVREALELFSDEKNWRYGGRCDPNSGVFDATEVASKTAGDLERAFTDACDEAGCAYDNEALLQAIADLKVQATLAAPALNRMSG
jgi:hypothetical protein